MASEQSQALSDHYRRSNAVAAMDPPLSLAELRDLQVGGAEILLDDARRFAERAREAGVKVELDVFADQQHTFQMMAGRAPEADEALARLSEWVRPHLGLDRVRP